MHMRQQAAIEFIISYSLALVIISLFVVSVLLLSDFSPPQTYIGSTCSIQPLIPCGQSLLTYNSIALRYYVVFTNQLAPVLYFPSNSINVTTVNLGSSGTQYSLGSCSPQLAALGATVICEDNISGVVKPSVGAQTSISFILRYEICNSGKEVSKVPSTCGSNSIYKSSGQSTQTIAPSTVKLENIGFTTTYNGTIVINGATYFNNTNALLPSGNYIIFANPAQARHFNYWSIIATGSSIANTASQNTTLVLDSNAFITANFV